MVYTQRSLSLSWSEGLARHTWYVLSKKSCPTWGGGKGSAAPRWGITGWKVYVERNKLSDWFAEVKHILGINHQPRSAEVPSCGGFSALNGVELWTTALLYLDESAENLDPLRVNLSARNKPEKKKKRKEKAWCTNTSHFRVPVFVLY